MSNTEISAEFPYHSHYVELHGAKMHYIEQGKGDTILFLHGVPTSSYVWRNVIPHLTKLGHCIAPDLMGFGKSDKPNIDYTVRDHIQYIEKFIDEMKFHNITLIMHGWGSIIGLDYAMRHPEKIKGLVFYEAYLRPQDEEETSLPYQEQMMIWSSQEKLNSLIANGTEFIDHIFPQTAMRSLTKEEMINYREPFSTEGSSKPLIQYLHDAENCNDIIRTYSKKLMTSNIPKLMLYSVPGFITSIDTVMWAKDNLPNLEVIDVGEEFHYAQESNPTLMGESISIWMQGIEQNF